MVGAGPPVDSPQKHKGHKGERDLIRFASEISLWVLAEAQSRKQNSNLASWRLILLATESNHRIHSSSAPSRYQRRDQSNAGQKYRCNRKHQRILQRNSDKQILNGSGR